MIIDSTVDLAVYTLVAVGLSVFTVLALARISPHFWIWMGGERGRIWTIEVRGKRHRWAFNGYGPKQHAEDWRADGLEVTEVLNEIPEWVVDIGLLRPWVAIQDCCTRLFGDGVGR